MGEKLKFLDLFSGIGGFRLGMEMAGHEAVGWCEIDKFARKSYEAMHNTEGEWTASDITKVSDNDIRLLAGKGIDVICGGFPCQAFSVAGKRGGFSDTRGTLFFHIARIAKIVQPKVLFLENVKGLLSHKTEVPFNVFLEVTSTEIKEGTLWEEKFSPMSNWSSLADNLEHYMSEKLQIQSDLKNLKLDTSSKKNWDLVSEKTEQIVDHGLRKRLVFLATQILLTSKKTNDYQKGQMQQSEEREEEWGLSQSLSSFVESLKVKDTSRLEKMVLTVAGAESSLNKNLGESYDPMKLFTTSMDEKMTTDQKISMYAQEMSILLFIIKQWKLSTNLWKKILLDLMKNKGGMYYVGTFNIILKTLDQLGYDAEWQVLNSKDFGVPQNRERVFIIGHLRGSGGREVFPIRGENSGIACELIGMMEGSGHEARRRVYDPKGLCPTPSGLGMVGNTEPKILDDQGRTNKKHKLQDYTPTLRRESHGNEPKVVQPILTPDRAKKRQNGRRVKEEGEPMFTLTSQDRHGVMMVGNTNPSGRGMNGQVYDSNGLSPTLTTNKGEGTKIKKNMRIRKLTPKECFRLQGFPDEYFERAKNGLNDHFYKGKDNSNSQLYKQAGNSVTVNVIHEIARRL